MALIFIKIGLKLSYFCQKKSFFSCAGGSDPHTLCLRWLGVLPPWPQLPPVVGGSAPRTRNTSPHCRYLATRLHEEKFTSRYCRPPFVLAFGFKYTWNVWWRRCFHSQTVYNTAKSISPGNTYIEKLSQKILSSAPIPLWLWPRWGFFFLNIVRSFKKF